MPRLRLESVEVREEVVQDTKDQDRELLKERLRRMRNNWLKEPAKKRKGEEIKGKSYSDTNEEEKNNKTKKMKFSGHTQACPRGQTQACPRGKITKQLFILDEEKY